MEVFYKNRPQIDYGYWKNIIVNKEYQHASKARSYYYHVKDSVNFK